MAGDKEERQDKEEYEIRKKAIFDSMAQRGRERILRIGYENWDPFQQPKDPRERIFSPISQQSMAMVDEFYRAAGLSKESVSLHKELFELCRGLLMEESRARAIFDLCLWLKEKGLPRTG
ncbi:MAG: hypothetical protein MUF52_02330 [Syntrophobacteraceae bacterium]|jgi:hypothetical protein|nr:hypothetical protein [Syntrophobacteraceae bacterium]